MQCPKCKNLETKVIDSRVTNEKRSIRRRRECEACSYRFTTFERIETAHFLVIKKDGAREQYNRSKLESGIWKACEKRPVTKEQIDTMINKLEEEWINLGKEISSEQVGEGIMNKLKDLDTVSYIRFASVYREFKDVASFKQALQTLLK